MFTRRLLEWALSIACAAPLAAQTPDKPAAAQRGLNAPTARMYGTAHADRWAVIVGISDYREDRLDLKFAHRDAEALYELIQTPGGGGFDSNKVVLLTNKDATTASITRALRSFLKKPAKDDIVLIFFAGHGAPDPDRPGNLYLLAYDTDPNDIAGTALPMRELELSIRENLNAERVVVMVDACHSAGIASIGLGAGRRMNVDNNAELLKNYLEGVARARPGMALLTSAEANQTSRESAEWGGGHGVFTHYVLEAMRGQADASPRDGVVTVGELFEFVRDRVKTATDGGQHPAVGTSPFDRNLPMAISAGLAAQEYYELGQRLYDLGWMVHDDGRLVAAGQQFGEALRMSRALPDASVGLARSLMALGDYRRAIEVVKRATDDGRRTTPELLRLQGVAHALAGDDSEAATTFEAALAADPRDAYGPLLRDYVAWFKARNGRPGRRRALLVGVDRIPNGQMLIGPSNDVKYLREVLASRHGFQTSDITVLTGTSASRRGVVDALEALARDASPADVVLIHYSGMGFADDSVRGGWLALHDSDARPGRQSEVADTALHRLLRAIPADRVLFSLDGIVTSAYRRLAESATYSVLTAGRPGEMPAEHPIELSHVTLHAAGSAAEPVRFDGATLGVVAASPADPPALILRHGSTIVRRSLIATDSSGDVIVSPSDPVRILAASGDGRTLAGISTTGDTVKIYDARSGERTGTFGGGAAGVTSVTLAADGRVLASTDRSSTVRIWALGRTTPRFELRDTRQKGGIATLTVHRTRYGAASETRTAGRLEPGDRLYEGSFADPHTVEAGRGDQITVRVLSDTLDPYLRLISPWGDTLANDDGDAGRNAKIVTEAREAGAWKALVSSASNPSAGPYELVVTTRRRLVTESFTYVDTLGASDRLVDAERLERRHAIAGAEGVHFVAELVAESRRFSLSLISPAGSVQGASTADASGSAVLDIVLPDSGKWVLAVAPDSLHRVQAAALSLDGRLLATGRDDGVASLYDVTDRRALRDLAGDAGRVRALSFSPDARQLLTASGSTVRLWDVGTGTLVRAFAGHTAEVTSVDMSSDGALVLVGAEDGSARLWDVRTGETRQRYTVSGQITSARFAPSGRQVLLSSRSEPALGLFSYGLIEALRSLDPAQLTPQLIHEAARVHMEVVQGAAMRQSPEVFGAGSTVRLFAPYTPHRAIFDVMVRPDDPRLTVWELERRYDWLTRVIGSDAPELHALFGQALVHRGGSIRAATALEAAVNKSSTASVNALLALGLERTRTQDYTKAVASFRAAAARSSVSPQLADAMHEVTARAEKMATGRKHALLVGINQYEYLASQRRPIGAVNDVRALERLLRERFGFAAADVRVLVDGAATRKAIVESFRDLAVKSREEPALFYFAGVGSVATRRDADQPESEQTMLTLVPVNGRGVGTDDIPLGELAALVPEDSSNLVAMIDAFAAGRIANPDTAQPRGRRGVGWKSSRTLGAPQLGFLTLYPPLEVTILSSRAGTSYSTGNEQVDTSVDSLEHGDLALALLERLQAATPNTTYAELLAAVSKGSVHVTDPADDRNHSELTVRGDLTAPVFRYSPRAHTTMFDRVWRAEAAEPLAQTIYLLRRLIDQRGGQYPDGYLNLGVAYAAREDWAMSVQALEKAISQRGDSFPEAHFHLGRVLYESGLDFTRAVSELRTAVKLAPDHAPSYYYLGRALRGMIERQSLVEARAALEEYLRRGAPLGRENDVRALLNQLGRGQTVSPLAR